MTAAEAVQAEFLQALNQAVARSAQLAAALAAEQEKSAALSAEIATLKTPSSSA